ncbi:MAG: AAA family ATPase, partial [Firmicutes bacterium]|nr:AAA family ATPase [Bacillota bacterium]
LGLSQLESTMSEHKEASKRILSEIEAHEKALRQLRQCTIMRWQGADSNLRMHLEVMGDVGSAETSLRNIIRRPDQTFSKDILDMDDDNIPKGGLIFDIAKACDGWATRNERVREMRKASLGRDMHRFGKPFAKHLTTLGMQSPDDIDKVMVWYPEDKIVLKLVGKDRSKEEDIETGSEGERTAAILSLMLLLDDSPIIIDQPEEDLDTKRISDVVVKAIREFKQKQQIIIVTHNPNIPVNGAAENIIQMNFAGGQIQASTSGALQRNEIRQAICDVMEGGKEALDKRYYRISRALEG